MWFTFISAALGADQPAAQDSPPAQETVAPDVWVEWRKDQARVRVQAPAGQKIGTDAPGRLSLEWGAEIPRQAELSGQGELLQRGVELGDLRGAALEGTLDVALCDLAGTTCRPTSWTVSGNVPTAKKGSTRLLSVPPSVEHVPFGPDASASAAEQAFARAKANGKLVLLDFSAVWCPPCQMLADEILHRDLPELEGFEVAVLDSDHPSSFALKDKYAISGYPTVVVVDADGNERSRVVGYDGAPSFLSWLASTPGSTDGEDLAKGPEQVAPARAAALARKLAEQRDFKDAEAWLARAETDAAVLDAVDLRLTRFLLRKDPADLAWLLEKAPSEAGRFAGTAVELLAEPERAKDEGLRGQTRRAVDLALRQAKGVALADMLYYAAQLAEATGDEPQARSYHAAAASVVRSALNGVPAHDKGYMGWLAAELEASGDADGAVAVLQDAIRTWPDEPTFDLSLAPLLLRLDRKEEALASAERAVELSWGDNRLRAVITQADVLVAMGRSEEAAEAARAELEAQPAPTQELDVRTHRYRARLEAFLETRAASK